MNPSTASHLTRLLTLLVLVGAVLLASTQQRAWATPAQNPFGQTIPTATPGQAATPAVTPPAARPAQGSIRRAVAPGIAATIATCDRGAAVMLPANALRAPGTMVVKPMTSSTLPTANPGFRLLGRASEVLLYDAQGRQILHPSFANPIRICFGYTADDLGAAEGDPANLVVQFFDTDTSTWVALPTTPDPSARRVYGSTTHLTLFALMLRSSAPGASPQTGAFETLVQSELPNTGGQAPGTPTWLWAFIAAALAVGISLVLRVRKFTGK